MDQSPRQGIDETAPPLYSGPRLPLYRPASRPDDASSRPPEGAREVFSEEMIGDFRRATASPFQGCGCQTSCSCNSSVGRALSLGFEADTAPAPNILHVRTRPLGPSPVVRRDLPMDLGRQMLGSE